MFLGFSLALALLTLSCHHLHTCHGYKGEASKEQIETYNKIKDIPVIKRMASVFYRRCHTRFHLNFMKVAPQALEICGKEKGFDYLNPNYPKLTNYATWPLGFDKCFHRCFLDRLYEDAGSKTPAIKLIFNPNDPVPKEFFDEDLLEARKSFSWFFWKKCRESAENALKENGIPEGSEKYNCGLAELLGTCVNYNFPRTEGNCYDLIEAKEVDETGPPFAD